MKQKQVTVRAGSSRQLDRKLNRRLRELERDGFAVVNVQREHNAFKWGAKYLAYVTVTKGKP